MAKTNQKMGKKTKNSSVAVVSGGKGKGSDTGKGTRSGVGRSFVPSEFSFGAVWEKMAGVRRFFQPDQIGYMVALLFVITAVSAAALGFVNSKTAPIVQEYQRAALDESIRKVFPSLSGSPELIEGSWESPVQSVRKVTDASAALLGYAVESAPIGYNGAITMLVGVRPDGVVERVEIVDMKETPGIGTKTNDGVYLEQYKGRAPGFTLGSGDNRVDVVSGASISSRAEFEGISAAVTTVLTLEQGGGAGE